MGGRLDPRTLRAKLLAGAAHLNGTNGVGGWTIAKWCERWDFSVPLFFIMQREGKAPKTIKLRGMKGSHRRITPAAEKEWLAAREAEAKREAQAEGRTSC